MKLEVRNFGKIKKGTIDLDKKVTVFVGYNNSGKTYMSQLLWKLNSLGDFFLNIIDFEAYVKKNITSKNSFHITKEVVDEIVMIYTNDIKKYYVPDTFNVSPDFFNNQNFSLQFLNTFEKIRTSSCVYEIWINDKYFYSQCYKFKKHHNSLEITVEDIKLPTARTYLDIVSEDRFREFEHNSVSAVDLKVPFQELLVSTVSNIIYELLFRKDETCFFLPANRIFYPSYYKYIYSVSKQEKDLINTRINNHASLESIKSLSKGSYTKAVDALTQKVYELNNDSTPKNNYSDLLDELRDIIGGDIIIKSAEGIAPIEFYLKLDDGKEIDMYLASSSANQLATLYLYLKYWAEAEKNFLIIDEPEENLHPENQIKLVNLLMKFADRNNNKILITTHSPLITDHINNYANLSYLKEAGVDVKDTVNNSDSHMALIENIKHEDYGVYFFDGEEINEYEVGNYGAYFEDFQKAENKVKDISNALKNHIYDKLHPDA